MNLFTSNQFAWPLEQQTEQIDRLSRESDRVPPGPETSSSIVELEISERLHHTETCSERIAMQILTRVRIREEELRVCELNPRVPDGRMSHTGNAS